MTFTWSLSVTYSELTSDLQLVPLWPLVGFVETILYSRDSRSYEISGYTFAHEKNKTKQKKKTHTQAAEMVCLVTFLYLLFLLSLLLWERTPGEPNPR